jgi:hypothetical protein
MAAIPATAGSVNRRITVQASLGINNKTLFKKYQQNGLRAWLKWKSVHLAYTL